MELKNVDFIVTAKHYSTAEGADGTVRGRISKMIADIRQRRGVVVSADLDNVSGDPVIARIWQGQWIADCECRGAQFVDPSEPIFFCTDCLNRLNNGRARPVAFPAEAERMEIEKLILARPVNDVRGVTDLERAGGAQPVIFVEIEPGNVQPLRRDWLPSETVEDLRAQNAPVEAWKKLPPGKKSEPVKVGKHGL